MVAGNYLGGILSSLIPKHQGKQEYITMQQGYFSPEEIEIVLPSNFVSLFLGCSKQIKFFGNMFKLVIFDLKRTQKLTEPQKTKIVFKAFFASKDSWGCFRMTSLKTCVSTKVSGIFKVVGLGSCVAPTLICQEFSGGKFYLYLTTSG